MTAALATAPATSSRSNPSRRNRRTVTVRMTSVPRLATKVIDPDSTADSPKPSCNNSGSMNGIALMPTRHSPPAVNATRKERTSSWLRSSAALAWVRAWRP